MTTAPARRSPPGVGAILIMGESARRDDDCAKSMASRGTPTITVSHAMGQQPGQDRHSSYFCNRRRTVHRTHVVAVCEPRDWPLYERVGARASREDRRALLVYRTPN